MSSCIFLSSVIPVLNSTVILLAVGRNVANTSTAISFLLDSHLRESQL